MGKSHSVRVDASPCCRNKLKERKGRITVSAPTDKKKGEKYAVSFAKIHEDAVTYTLTRNYRSTPQILNASNRLIRNNRNRTGKDLVAVREDGEPVRFAHFNSNREEAEWIADRIREMTGNGIGIPSDGNPG